jgi:hypothetical protein
MGSPAKGVNRYSVPRVRIPVFPPLSFSCDKLNKPEGKLHRAKAKMLNYYLSYIIRACSSGVRAVGS